MTHPGPGGGRAPRPAVWLGAALLGTVALAIVYRDTLGHPLTSDGRFLTVQNIFMQRLDGLARVWTADFFAGAITHGVTYLSGYYRPITNTLLWFEVRLAGDGVVVYHLVGLILHAVNAVLAAAVILRLGGDRLAAAIAGVVFLIHPIHAFAATDPAARADVLFPTFYLAAVWVFDRGLSATTRAARWRAGGATVVLYLCAVLSKEMGITLPAILTLLAWWRYRGDGGSLRPIGHVMPVWIAFGLYLIWRFGVLQLAPPDVGYSAVHPSLWLYLAAAKAAVIQLTRIVLPLGAGYPELNPQLFAWIERPWSDPLTYVALGVMAGFLGLILTWRRHPAPAFWAAWFLVTVSPLFRVDNIAGGLSTLSVLTQERWIYLPAVGVIALLAHAAAAGWRRLSSPVARRWTVAPAGALALWLAWSAAQHAGRHNDPFARLRHLYLMPEDRMGRMEHANRLMLYAQWVAVPMGDLREAEARTRAAVALVPDSPVPAVALAGVLAESGRWADVTAVLDPWDSLSRDQLLDLHETNPRIGDDVNRVNPQVVFHLGQAYAHTGDPDRSRRYLCEAARREHVPAAVPAALAVLPGPPGCADP